MVILIFCLIRKLNVNSNFYKLSIKDITIFPVLVFMFNYMYKNKALFN